MTQPRILFWDLETSDLNGNWGTVLCAGFKFKGEKPKIISTLDYPKAFKKDPTNDYYVIKDFYEVLVSADMWVTWYGGGFDVRMFNTKLAEHKLPALPPIPHVDGWKIAKFKLKFNSNRLATVSQFLEVEEKTPVKGKIWKRAIAGHRPSLKYIIEHCYQDVVVLEEVYERIKYFAPEYHPNFNLITGQHDACPTCGVAGKMQKRGIHHAKTSMYQRYHCQACGAWCRSRTAEKRTPVLYRA